MLTYRTFQNTDPPAVAAIWRSRAGQPGLLQPVSADLLEQLIFGKVYFDYQGLILAFEGGRPIGFAHAAFGPNEKRDGIATEQGVICVIMVCPDCAETEVAEGLLGRCESYLRHRHAKVVYGGAVQPCNPFYLGLYGGSVLPGVLESDKVAKGLYPSHGYQELERTLLFCRPLSEFRPLVDRRQLQCRRQLIVEEKTDPPFRDWWEACTTGDFDLTRFQLVQRGGGSVLASVRFREMQPTGRFGSGRTAGLLDVHVAPSHRRRGLATFLLGESFRQLARHGVTLIEAQATGRDVAGIGLAKKLGMKQVDQGLVFRKEMRADEAVGP